MKHIVLAVFLLISGAFIPSYSQQTRHTQVEIKGDKFYINGNPTYANRIWKKYPIEGLLMNSRMVQGIFDDMNPKTVSRWKYTDTGKWDADRNTDEFIAHMEEWKNHGMLSFTINLQGGSPEGYSRDQPWHNSAFTENGELIPAFLYRLERILNHADELGMVPMVGFFYFGQDERLLDETAVKRAVSNAVNWLHSKNYRNVLIEINNESNVRYDHDILKPERVHELIDLAKSIEKDGYRYYVSTSYGGGFIPLSNVVQSADYLLLHGNGVKDPNRIPSMVKETREVKGYTPKPIIFNEDDHFDFDKDWNNFIAAVSAYTSWGYFDFRMKDEGYEEGYQSVPVDWGINSARKRGFFDLMKTITGY